MTAFQFANDTAYGSPPSRGRRGVCGSLRTESRRQCRAGRSIRIASTAELLAETFDIVGMTVADTADRDAGNEIQIFISIDVDDGATLGTVDHDLRISHIGYDRIHTTAEDSNSWFPLRALRRAATAGRIGEIAPRFHGAPTNRSHRTTLDQDCPELLARCREDKVDAVIIVAV